MKSQGFTIIELMIVVAIVAFLATIAVPQYFQYQAKAKQAEVAMMLASAHTAEQAYFAEHGEYSEVLFGENGIGWKPEGYKGGGKQENFFYTYGFNASGAQEGKHYFTGKSGVSHDGLGQTVANKQGFALRAVADLRGNGKLDVWQVDEARNIKHVQDGLT